MGAGVGAHGMGVGDGVGAEGAGVVEGAGVGPGVGAGSKHSPLHAVLDTKNSPHSARYRSRCCSVSSGWHGTHSKLPWRYPAGEPLVDTTR